MAEQELVARRSTPYAKAQAHEFMVWKLRSTYYSYLLDSGFTRFSIEEFSRIITFDTILASIKFFIHIIYPSFNPNPSDSEWNPVRIPRDPILEDDPLVVAAGVSGKRLEAFVKRGIDSIYDRMRITNPREIFQVVSVNAAGNHKVTEKNDFLYSMFQGEKGDTLQTNIMGVLEDLVNNLQKMPQELKDVIARRLPFFKISQAVVAVDQKMVQMRHWHEMHGWREPRPSPRPRWAPAVATADPYATLPLPPSRLLRSTAEIAAAEAEARAIEEAIAAARLGHQRAGGRRHGRRRKTRSVLKKRRRYSRRH